MHQIRSIRFIGHEDLGDWRLKVYGIGTQAPHARPVLGNDDVDAYLAKRGPETDI